jgi:hypothetical protein
MRPVPDPVELPLDLCRPSSRHVRRGQQPEWASSGWDGQPSGRSSDPWQGVTRRYSAARELPTDRVDHRQELGDGLREMARLIFVGAAPGTQVYDPPADDP